MKKNILIYTAAAMSAISLLLTGCIPEISIDVPESRYEISVNVPEDTSEPAYEESYAYSEAVSFGTDKIYEALVAGLQNADDVVKLDGAVDFEEVDLAMNMVIWYHPEIFWISGYEVVTDGFSSEITINYLSDLNSGDIRSMRNELDAAVDRIIAMIPPGSDNFGKIVFVHDYIVEHTDYDSSGLIETITGKSGLYGTSYGCLVQGSAVCQGYALGFMYIMQKLGIESGMVGGECDRGSHAWNYVELNGVNYWVDVTWDDPSFAGTNDKSIGNLSHSYCLIDDNCLLRTRTISYDSRKIPVCRFMTDNYFNRNNAYFHIYDKDAVGAVLDAGASGRSAEMMFSNKEALDEAVEKLFKKGDLWRISDVISPSDTVTYSIDDDMYVLKLEY